MADPEPNHGDRSLMETLHWLFFGQYSNTRADGLRQAFVFVAVATSFLAFVGATTVALQTPQLYWVTLGLGVLGVVMLVFGWMLVFDQVEGLFPSDPEANIDTETAGPDDRTGSEQPTPAESEQETPNDSDVEV